VGEAIPDGERSPSPRARLSRDLVLDAAVRLADAEGLDALSMRHLAKTVGAEAMSLYHHVPNKEELLAGMLDRVLDEMAPAEPGPDWRGSVRVAMVSRREVLLRHPWAADLQLRGLNLSPSRLRHMEGLLAALKGGGFDGDLADHAYHAIDISVLGWSLWEARYDAITRDAPPDLAATAREALGDDWPMMSAHLAFHLRPPAEPRVSTFELSLDLLLDGLERLRLARLAE
jgi:AcrR family transcriptional regulator